MGLRPGHHWRNLQHSRRPLAGFHGLTSKEGEGKGWEGRERGKEKKRGEEKRGDGKGNSRRSVLAKKIYDYTPDYNVLSGQ